MRRLASLKCVADSGWLPYFRGVLLVVKVSFTFRHQFLSSAESADDAPQSARDAEASKVNSKLLRDLIHAG